MKEPPCNLWLDALGRAETYPPPGVLTAHDDEVRVAFIFVPPIFLAGEFGFGGRHSHCLLFPQQLLVALMDDDDGDGFGSCIHFPPVDDRRIPPPIYCQNHHQLFSCVNKTCGSR